MIVLDTVQRVVHRQMGQFLYMKYTKYMYKCHVTGKTF